MSFRKVVMTRRIRIDLVSSLIYIHTCSLARVSKSGAFPRPPVVSISMNVCSQLCIAPN